MSILTHDEAKRLSQSSTDPLEVIRNVEAAVIIKLAGSQNALKDEVRLIWKPKCDALRQQLKTAQTKVKHLSLHLKATQSGRDAALARPAITEEANSMLLARNKWLEHALEVAGASPVEPSQARVVELVAAANKDAVLQASIDFIRELTGMEPPPIEVAPPETFQPFKTFADKVCAIFATPQAAAQPPAPSDAAREYMTGYSDAKEWAGATSQAQPSQADAQDAARYRWLAGHCRSTSEHWGGRWSIVVDGPAPKSHDSEDDFDAAIDAAINAKERAAHGIKQGGQHD